MIKNIYLSFALCIVILQAGFVFAQCPATSVIYGNSSVCPNTYGVSYSVVNTTGSNYAWTITGGVVASGAGTNSITVNWGSVGLGNVSVVETSASGCVGTAVNKGVTISSTPLTSPIVGGTTMCVGGVGTYTVVNNTGSTYAWLITGGNVSSGQGTNSITVSWGSGGSGNVQVTETFSCHDNVTPPFGISYVQGSPVNLPVTIGATSPNVFGLGTVCQNSAGDMYTTEAGRTGYIWNVPVGVITSGGSSTDNTVTVKWPGLRGSTTTISVSYIDPVLGCLTAPTFKIINVLSTSPTISGNQVVCQNSTGNTYTTESGMTNYVWNVSPGGVITSGGTSDSNTVTVT
jgi:hypothetical protein